MAIQQMFLGAGGGGGGKSIDELFNTHLFTGNDTPGNARTTGIDLTGSASDEGGLVWFKPRVDYSSHSLYDTERGAAKYLMSNTGNGEYDVVPNYGSNHGLTSFNNNGFTVGTNVNGENGSLNIVAWTFRRYPEFFDIVKWNGSTDNASKTINHNLGTNPGMIIIKNYSTTGSTDWYTYHSALDTPNQNYIRLEQTAAAATPQGQNIWNATSTSFQAAEYLAAAQANNSYVAYLFAEDTDYIKCGEYDSNYAVGATPQTVDLGWEPQFVMIKHVGPTTYSNSGWYMFDNERVNSYPSRLYANTTGGEPSTTYIDITSTGFTVDPAMTGWAGINYPSGDKHIYMAIRKPD